MISLRCVSVCVWLLPCCTRVNCLLFLFHQVAHLYYILSSPFVTQETTEEAGYAAKPPAWAQSLKVSCSSWVAHRCQKIQQSTNMEPDGPFDFKQQKVSSLLCPLFLLLSFSNGTTEIGKKNMPENVLTLKSVHMSLIYFANRWCWTSSLSGGNDDHKMLNKMAFQLCVCVAVIQVHTK